MKNTEFDINLVPFADDSSRVHFEAACKGDPLPGGFARPMIVIIGPPDLTFPLANELTLRRFGHRHGEVGPYPGTEVEMRNILDRAAADRDFYLWLDGAEVVHSKSLSAFISAGKWDCRGLQRFRLASGEPDVLDCQLILTGEAMEFAPGLLRRLRIISLGPIEPVRLPAFFRAEKDGSGWVVKSTSVIPKDEISGGEGVS